MPARKSPHLSGHKIIISIGLAIITIATLHYFFISTLERRAQKNREQQLRQLVELGRHAILPYIVKIQQGEMSASEALPEVRRTLRQMTFTDHSGKNYLFLTQFDGTVLVQPFEQAMEGTNQLGLKDADGIFIIKRLIEAAQKFPAGSFVQYRYRPPNSTVPHKKISFVVSIPELQAYLGTGIYLTDIEKEVAREMRESLFLCFLALLAFTTPVLFHLFTLKRHTQHLKDLQKKSLLVLEKLKTTEEKYNTIIENCTEGIAIIKDGKLFLLNSGEVDLIGYSKEDLQNFDFIKVIHPDDVEILMYRYKRRMEGLDTPRQYPIRIISQTGRICWLLLNAVKVTWEGEPALLVLMTNIDTLKEAHEILEDKEIKFRSLMEQAPFPIAIFNPQGVLQDKNKQWPATMSSPPSIDAHKYNVLEDKQLQEQDVIFEIQKAFSGQNIVTEPTPLVTEHNSDTLRWMALRLYPIVGQDNEIRSVVLMLIDHTDNILAEQRQSQLLENLSTANKELRQTQGIIKDIIDSMPSALICVNKTGEVMLWNQVASEMFGISAFHANKRTLEIISPRLAAHLPLIKQAQMDLQPKKIERNPLTHSGITKYEDIVIYPLSLAGSRGAVIRIDDVTERVRLEEIMVQTEKMMSVGGLAAGMAHEINNPLGGILQGEQNLRRRLLSQIPANQEAADAINISLNDIATYLEARNIPSFLSTIREAGERAARIVSHMLTFSRQSSTELIPAKIEEIVDRTLELAASDYDLRKRYDFKHIEIIKKYTEDLPQAACIPSEIEQVLLNILKNAAQALEGGTFNDSPPTITITIARQQNYIRTTIADNGPGMTEEQKNKAFEPFYTTKEIGTGTGLGLSVSFFIITTRHHGLLTIDSTPRKGASFTIDIPIAS